MAAVGNLSSFSSSNKPAGFPSTAENWVRGDFKVKSDLQLALAGCDRVIHLVSTSTPGSSDANRIADLSENLLSTIQLLDLCVEQKVEQIIFMSSGGSIYGNSSMVPTPESSETNPTSSYGVVKLAIEKYLQIYKDQHGLDYRIIRASNPFGPYQTGKNKQGLIGAVLQAGLNNREFEIWGDGSLVRDFIFVEDLVKGVMAVMSYQGEERIFNMGSGVGSSVLQIINLCKDALYAHGYDLKVRFKEARPSDVKASTLDISLAQKELGWMPHTDLKSGIEKTLTWMELNLS